MRKDILTFLFFIGFYFFIFESNARSTLDQIKINNPNLDSAMAEQIANAIDKYSDEYKVPANVLAAIAMVESSYNVKAVNGASNDYGLFQINMFNIKAYKFDKDLLISDIDYSVKAGVIVFEWFYRRYELDVAIKRFNCGTRKSCITWESVVTYLYKVKRYM